MIETNVKHTDLELDCGLVLDIEGTVYHNGKSFNDPDYKETKVKWNHVALVINTPKACLDGLVIPLDSIQTKIFMQQFEEEILIQVLKKI